MADRGQLAREPDQPRLVDAGGVDAGDEQDRAAGRTGWRVAAAAQRAVSPRDVDGGFSDRLPAPVGDVTDETLRASRARHERGAAAVEARDGPDRQDQGDGDEG